MPTEFIVATIVVVAIAIVVGAWLLWRRSRRAADAAAEIAAGYPESGMLVSEEVLAALSSTTLDVHEALERAATPIAIEYYPMTAVQVAKLKTVPVNATAQQALVDVVKALNPKNPTLLRAVLPKGAELVQAVGQSGFRGFSRSGGKTVHAVLKPVAVGGAIVAGWPALAVAGAVLVTDMVAQREMRAHQRRVESILGRQEERAYRHRIAAQVAVDEQLSRAIGLMLDGKDSALELALHGASQEFSLAQQFLRDYDGVVERLVDAAGKIDYWRLEEALGGKDKDVDGFVRELHLAQAAIAIQRKAVIADAAARALEDPTNPYLALRSYYQQKVEALDRAETTCDELTSRLNSVEFKWRWRDGVAGRFRGADASIAARQERFRARIAPPTVDGTDETLEYVVLPSGEIRQVVTAEDDELALTTGDPTARNE